MIKRLPMIVANDSSVRFITFFTFCSSQEASVFVNKAIRTELTIPILQFTSLHHSKIHRLLREPDAFVGVET
jgi:hypothetical protein